jgi:hypothetical protein
MATSDNKMSVNGQHALQDMVELEMYLLAQSQQTPWHMLPRATKLSDARKPYSNRVDWSAARELLNGGFIEATSNLTFVVSKSGYQFYELSMKPHFKLNG